MDAERFSGTHLAEAELQCGKVSVVISPIDLNRSAMSAIDDWTILPNDTSAFSLLSLSIAAANAAPIPVAQVSGSSMATAGLNSVDLKGSTLDGRGNSVCNGVKQQRRLSSSGKARRRFSDARDAATRPLPAAVQAVAVVSPPSISLSASLPTQGLPHLSTSSTPAPNALAHPQQPSMPVNNDASQSHSLDELGSGGFSLPPHLEVIPNGSSGNITNMANIKVGKKKGTDYRCESCSKIYRHPSCLIKHRWEHTPHWHEASKFVLSKHQQVQLLEAAAILSHLSPSSSTGTSLPEDRSLWPSFLSGGAIPLPSGTVNIAINGIGMPNPNLTCQSCPPYNTHTMSSSVPAHALRGSNRATSAGPRLHDYSIPATAKASGGLTQLRPGLLGVSTRSGSDLCSVSQPFEAVSDPPGCTALKGSLPVPVPGSDVMSDWAQCHGHEHRPTSGMAGPQGYFMSSQNGHSLDHLIVPNSFSGGGWSLPRSSLRSGSMSSRSGSRSGSRNRSDDESECVNGNLDEINNAGDRQKRGFSSRGRSKEGANVWKREEDELNLEFSLSEEDEDIADEGSQRMTVEEAWDGMDMDMDMD